MINRLLIIWLPYDVSPPKGKVVNFGHDRISSGRGACPGHSIGYNLAAIAALVMLVAVGAAYLIDRAGRTAELPPPSLSDGQPVVQTVGGRELTIPTNWIRHGEQIRPGFASQVDIRVELDLFPGADPVRSR